LRNETQKQGDWGVLCILTAAVLYSIGGLCIKVIPWSGLAINGGRTAIALVVVGGYLAVTRHRPRFNRWVLLGALCICGTNCLFTVANKLTTAANAIVLQFTAPMFVVLLSALFLRRKPQGRDLAACAAVLLGVVCCCLDSLAAGSVVGDLLALASGLTYAVVFLLNEMPDGDPISSVFWGSAMSAVIGLPFLLQETEFTPVAVTSLVVLGVFQVAAAYIFMTIGLKTTPPVTASLVSGIEPVLNPILVAVFYHETIGPLALLGAAIVIGAVLIYNVINAKHDTIKENISHDFV
jgi:drug/metabolite transporter (DMT)-like permease